MNATGTGVQTCKGARITQTLPLTRGRLIFLLLQVGLPNFIEEKFTPSRLPEFALNALSNSPLENHYNQLKRRFDSPKMRALLSFQDLYVGESVASS